MVGLEVDIGVEGGVVVGVAVTVGQYWDTDRVGVGVNPGGGAYSFVARLSHLTLDHASFSKRSTVPTPCGEVEVAIGLDFKGCAVVIAAINGIFFSCPCFNIVRNGNTLQL